jgi:hypothetical protein
LTTLGRNGGPPETRSARVAPTGGLLTGGPPIGGPLTGGPLADSEPTGGPLTDGLLTGGPLTGGLLTGGPGSRSTVVASGSVPGPGAEPAGTGRAIGVSASTSRGTDPFRPGPGPGRGSWTGAATGATPGS